MKYGVIDIGSNSVRLMMSENGKTLYKKVNITRLADGLAGNSVLNSLSIERTVNAVCEFYGLAVKEGANKIYAFATAAVRQAENGKDFTDRVKERCGLDVDVIDGRLEAYIGAMGALKDADGGIIDVGGGSTEITVIKGKKETYSYSLPFGAVKLNDIFNDDVEKLYPFLNQKVKEYGNIPKSEFFGIGGTVTCVASVMQELEPYDSNKVDGYKIYKKELKVLRDRLFEMTLKEREKLKGLQKGREKIIASGVAILYEIIDFLGVDYITASESDNLEGYLKLRVDSYE